MNLARQNAPFRREGDPPFALSPRQLQALAHHPPCSLLIFLPPKGVRSQESVASSSHDFTTTRLYPHALAHCTEPSHSHCKNFRTHFVQPSQAFGDTALSFCDTAFSFCGATQTARSSSHFGRPRTRLARPSIQSVTPRIRVERGRTDSAGPSSRLATPADYSAETAHRFVPLLTTSGNSIAFQIAPQC
jgi:hypothetical protein